MKLLITIILLTTTLPNCLNAQNFTQLNFIKYQVIRKDITGKSGNTGYICLWFNDSISYKQEWPMPNRVINDDGSNYTEKDSIKNAEFIKAVNKDYYESNRTTYLLNTNKDSSSSIVDYDVLNGKPFYFKQKAYSNRFTDVIDIKDSSRIISGKICKLATGIYNDPYDSSKTPLKIWYSIDIVNSSSPILWIKNMRGLIMAIESDHLNLTAINLEMPATTVGNFRFDVPTTSYHTREEYDTAYKEYFRHFENN